MQRDHRRQWHEIWAGGSGSLGLVVLRGSQGPQRRWEEELNSPVTLSEVGIELKEKELKNVAIPLLPE